jgi:hypothetical protein
MSMLRPIYKARSAAQKVALTRARMGLSNTVLRTFATQSGDDVEPPTALAKIHLEDGTTLTGKSFGAHKAVEGEVRILKLFNSVQLVPCLVGCFERFCFLGGYRVGGVLYISMFFEFLSVFLKCFWLHHDPKYANKIHLCMILCLLKWDQPQLD